MRLFLTKGFARFARRERMTTRSLIETIQRAECGSIDADLGGGLIKQRVARSGQGRSGGYRIVAAYRAADRAVILLGFAKNERENIGPDELISLRQIASGWLKASEAVITAALEAGSLQEVFDVG